MSFLHLPMTDMLLSGESNQPSGLVLGHSGQQLHVSGVFIILLELALVLENLLPILVVVVWLPVKARGVGDRLVAAFSVTCILSALVPTPLGLASYFSGGWYGGTPTCTTYQVTSIWCNLSSLALLTYICLNCNFAVCHLRQVKSSPQVVPRLIAAPTPQKTHTSAASPSPLTSLNGSTRHQHPTTNSQSVAAFHGHCNQKDKSSLLKEHHGGSKECFVQKKKSRGHDEIQSERFVNQVETDESSSRQTLFLSDKLFNPTGDSFSPKISGKPDQTRLKLAAKEFSLTSFDKHCSSSLKALLNGNERNSSVDTHDVTSRPQRCAGSCALHSNRMNGYAGTANGVGYVQLSHWDDGTDSETGPKSCLPCQNCQSRDYVSLTLFLLFTVTLVIASLPVIGLGPRTATTEITCRSWLVPIPEAPKEMTFYVTFLVFVGVCLATGCSSGISVCLQVSRRMKQERRRRSRLYHEEENVPDLVELSVLDDMRRQYSLTCIVMAGQLTWIPILLMMTLQKIGVEVSEATLMYSNIATSLPGLLNPLLYSLALDRYRAGYKAILEKCCCKGRRQKTHHLSGVHCSLHGPADHDGCLDTNMNTSAEGHSCLHGRCNPNFENSRNDVIDDDDEDEDEDYFPDDSEALNTSSTEQGHKLSEKTPLHAVTVLPSAGVFKTVLASQTKSPWSRHHDTLTCGDKEGLLVTTNVFADDETGL
ncbi:unnamed protein product [Lymnaea stagnalis]|uniref:G-protein coupled receptors family 1 profile domain-containing protein n=1 Tax=Lymnaea stagnalis TaxID=6523 RepID=A0AAV2H2M6_LYMST